MALFLKGKFKVFHKVGPSECVRDIFRFRQLKENSVQLELTRRDMETRLGRFWRYENAQMTLIPLDEAQPRLGGKVKVNAFIFDIRTFTPQLKTFYGVYSDDFVTFGEFSKEAGNPLENEELLLKVVDENDTTTVPDRVTFRFQDNTIHYKREVNSEVKDPEIEHSVSENKLQPVQYQTWSEVLFYGLGNQRV